MEETLNIASIMIIVRCQFTIGNKVFRKCMVGAKINFPFPFLTQQ